MTDEQAKLVEKHIRFVHYLVGRMHYSPLDYEDAVGFGMVGLVQAASRYESCHGSFTNYASHRIIGNVKDAVRRELGRGDRGPKSPKWYSLEEFLEETGMEFPDEQSQEPELGYEYNLYDLITVLTPREHVVFYMNRVAGFPYSVLAARLGFSESWACQIGKKAKAKLHARMHEIQVWHPS